VANLIVLPMAFLAGSFIPLDVAPGWLKGVSHVLPQRYLNEGMLDVMVRGKGPVRRWCRWRCWSASRWCSD
jgi:ABC-2 type transport system permease protein